jgi:hypothetical protein
MVKFVSYFVRTHTQFLEEWMLMIFTYVEHRGYGPPKIPCQIVQVSYRYLTFNLIFNEIYHRKITFLLICHGRIEILNILKMRSEYYIMIVYRCFTNVSEYRRGNENGQIRETGSIDEDKQNENTTQYVFGITISNRTKHI